MRRVPEREDLVVDLLEGLLVKDPRRTLLLESTVEAADLAWNKTRTEKRNEIMEKGKGPFF